MKEPNLLNSNVNSELVSIILPTFNSEKYIDKCLNSIFRQTYKNIELIVIDGFSTDDTIKIVNNYKDLIKTVVYQINTKNLAEALNFGIKKSNGDYIARMDSDDIMTKNRILAQVNYFRNNDFHGVLGTQAIRFNKYSLKPFILKSENLSLKLDLYFGSPFVHPSVMMSRNIFDKNFFYNKNFDECEDYELWTRISDNFPFHNLLIPHLFYRVHKNSASNLKSSELHKFKKIILRNHFKKINLELSDEKLSKYLKIISLQINKNDNFNELNSVFLDILYSLYLSKHLSYMGQDTLKSYLKGKYFRFCLRSLIINSFSFNVLDQSIFKFNLLRFIFLKFLYYFKISL